MPNASRLPALRNPLQVTLRETALQLPSRVERAISIRLDDDAQQALRTLTRSGRTQSEAVREALIALARSKGRADLAEAAERLSADRSHRAEKTRIAAFDGIAACSG